MTAPATAWALRAVRGGQYILMQHTPSGMWTDMCGFDNLGSARLVLELVTEGETARNRGNVAGRDPIGPGHAGRQT